MGKILKLLWREIQRAHMQGTLRKKTSVPIRKAIALWSLSDVIYLGPCGAGARRVPELELYKRYCASESPSDEELEALLTHRSPSVAGYAFEILMARGSDVLPAALEILRPRKSIVSMGFTSFVVYEELGDYARSRYEAVKGGSLQTTSE